MRQSNPDQFTPSIHSRLTRLTRPMARILTLAILGGAVLSCAEPATGPVDTIGMTLLVLGGDNQVGPPGVELPLPLRVKALSRQGVPLVGIVVNFRVTSGGGSLFAGSALTDRQGRATDYWTLGPELGAQNLEVRAVFAEGEKAVFAHFTATATEGTAEGIIAAGAYQTCAIATDGRAYCWGDNASGDIGDGTTIERKVPTLVSGDIDFATVSGGYWHTCGLGRDGTGYCWGFNSYGDLGDGTNTARLVPTPVAGGHQFVQLESGTWTGCGLVAGGAAWCWGNNDYGRVGDGTTTHRNTPVAVIGGLSFTSIVAGANLTCGLVSGGQAYCWGQNNSGQLGDGTLTDRHQPTAVSGGHSFSVLALGYAHTCGLTEAGVAYCWGLSSNGQVGDGHTTDRTVPTPVAGGLTFRSLIAGGRHTCGTLASGAAMCWGQNSPTPAYGGGGQLGDGTLIDRLVPTAVAGGLGFSAMTAGESHTCGIATTGSAWCWGNNAYGQLGDDSNENRLVPTPVTGGLSFPAAASGSAQ